MKRLSTWLAQMMEYVFYERCYSLCGFATRMYPLTKNFPKPLLEVGGKRVLDYFIEQINRLPEVETVHIVSNDKFYDHFENWRRQNERSGIFGNYS